MRFLDQSRFDFFVHNFVPCYSLYGEKDRLSVINFDGNQNNSRYMRQALARGASRCTLQELLSANSSNIIRRTFSINDDTASPSSDLNDHESHVRKLQIFWRKHYPRVLDARKFNQSLPGRETIAYLNLVATCVPKDNPSRSTVKIRAQFVTKGIELQIALATTTQKLQSLRKVFSDLFADSSLPPSRLEALQESCSSLALNESTVAHIRASWSTRHLRTQHWWFDQAKLQNTLTEDLERVISIQEQLNTLELV